MAFSNRHVLWTRSRIIESFQTGAVECLADEVDLVGRLNADPLARAIALALRSAGELRTVTRLAAEIGVDRRRLVERWNRLPGHPVPLHLSDYLNLLLLLRACAAYQDFGSWFRVGNELGVHVRTLRRIATQAGGLQLGEVRERVPPELAAALSPPVVKVLHRSMHPWYPTTLVNFPRLGGHPVKPEGRFRLEVFNDSEAEEVLTRVQAGSAAPGGGGWQAGRAGRPGTRHSCGPAVQWKSRRAKARNPAEAFPGNGVATGEAEEIRRLRRQLEQVKQERDFLRKAAAYFAQKSE